MASSDSEDTSVLNSDSTEDEDVAELRNQVENQAVGGYLFEPMPVEHGELQQGAQQEPERDGDVRTWCQCGICVDQDKSANRHCCQEVQALKTLANGSSVGCITLHPGFEPVVLNRYVLELTYNQYKHLYGQIDMPLDRRWRHLCYRNLVMWVWGRLGKRNRKALPSCILKVVRDRFPSVTGEYKGHKHS